MTARDVDSALADLALHAVARLAREMETARNPKDRIAAANSVLDRLGYGRSTRVQSDVADREIRNAIAAAVREVGDSPEEVANAIAQASHDIPDDKAPDKAPGTDEAQVEVTTQGRTFTFTRADLDALNDVTDTPQGMQTRLGDRQVDQ